MDNIVELTRQWAMGNITACDYQLKLIALITTLDVPGLDELGFRIINNIE